VVNAGRIPTKQTAGLTGGKATDLLELYEEQTTMPAAQHSLRSISAFANVHDDVISRLDKRCAWRCYQRGEPIVDYLDKTDDVQFVVSGRARASIYSLSGKMVTFCDLSAGEMFGEYAAIDGGPRSVGIESVSNCVIASLAAPTFREILQSEPSVTLALVEHLVGKVRQLTARVYEFSILAVNNRIQAEILRIARRALCDGGRARIEVPPTHVEIASRTSTHREAVTRELNRLARLGIIKREGKALIVEDILRLETMVQEATGE
jgi:CRP/FNR family transcriptional regulator, cyclic AMP receptor protein